MVSEVKEKAQKARKGFTLVELLIVIIIIGILAGAMMLVAGSSRDAAEASKIISDLRNVKAAALMWMTESPTTIDNNMWLAFEDDPTPLNKYLDRPLSKNQETFKFSTATMTVASDDVITSWILGYDVTDARDGVKSNLEKQADSAGLYGGSEGDTLNIDLTNPASTDYYSTDDDIVYVVVQ